MSMEAIPEILRAQQIESNTSSMINLEQQADGEGESITSSMIMRVRHSNPRMAVNISRASLDRATLLMKTGEDSTFILAQQIESLREMER